MSQICKYDINITVNYIFKMFKHLYNIHTIIKNRYQFYIYNFYYTNQSITDNFEIKLNYTLFVFPN